MRPKPLAIDLFCGLGGWTSGLLAEGYRVVGFDVERHVYGEARYPAQLVLQDVLTIHGAQFASAALIVASPPCQEYSYMAMPWSKAKEKAAALRDGRDDPKRLTALFDACFRIQREACEAAGRYIPLVVENVCGAQKWVGRAKWHFGSFYLWGDVPALMPIAKKHIKVNGFRFDGSGKSFQSEAVKVATMGAGWYPPDHPKHVPGLAFNGHAERNLRNEGVKVPTERICDCGHTEDHHGFRPDEPCDQCSCINPVYISRRTTISTGARFTSRDCGIEAIGIKQGGDWFNKASGNSISRRCSSRSVARKAASANIAKIPIVLSRHIAKSWYPEC